MKLTIFNGSPKPGKCNTELMAAKFAEGFLKTGGNACENFRLSKMVDMEEAAARFEQADVILLAFPLYNCAMPSGVKEFMEALEPLCGRCGGKKIGFLVQFGFLEGVHARALEQYLEKLTSLLGGECVGTIVKGGCDSLAKDENSADTRKILDGVERIGARFGETGTFDRKLLDAYSKPETETGISRLIMKPILAIINKTYWDADLKKNGALAQRFAKPYQRAK